MAGFGFSIGDIILASSIALSIYNSSKQAGKEFRSIANDAASLQSSLCTLREEIERPQSLINRSSELQRAELSALIVSCKADLEDIDEKLLGYKSLQKSKSRTRDKLRFTPGTQAEIRSKIARNSDRLNRFLNGLHTGALGRVDGNTEQHFQSFDQIVAKLDKIHQDVLQKKKDASVLADMNELQQELIDDNITEVDIESNEDEIAEWLTYIRGTANLQELLKDITNNPWNEQGQPVSPKMTSTSQTSFAGMVAMGATVESKEENGTENMENSIKGTKGIQERVGEPHVKDEHVNASADFHVRDHRTPPPKLRYQATVEDYALEHSSGSREMNSDRASDSEESHASSSRLHTSCTPERHDRDTASKLRDFLDDIKQDEHHKCRPFQAIYGNKRINNGGRKVSEDPGKIVEVIEYENHDSLTEFPKARQLCADHSQPPSTLIVSSNIQDERRNHFMPARLTDMALRQLSDNAKFPPIPHDAHSIRCASPTGIIHFELSIDTESKTELSISEAIAGLDSIGLDDHDSTDGEDTEDSCSTDDYLDPNISPHLENAFTHPKSSLFPQQRRQYTNSEPHHNLAPSSLYSPKVTYQIGPSTYKCENPFALGYQRLQRYTRNPPHTAVATIKLNVTLREILEERQKQVKVAGRFISIQLHPTCRHGDTVRDPACQTQFQFIIKENAKPYIRKGDDIYFDVTLKLSESLCDFQRRIPLVDGSQMVIYIPGPVPHNWTTVLDGHGMPKNLNKAPGNRGNLTCALQVFNILPV